MNRQRASADSSFVDLYYKVDNYELTDDEEDEQLANAELEQLGIRPKDMERFARYLSGQSMNLHRFDQKMTSSEFQVTPNFAACGAPRKIMMKSRPALSRLITVDLNSSPDTPFPPDQSATKNDSSKNVETGSNATKEPDVEAQKSTNPLHHQHLDPRELRETIAQKQRQSDLAHQLMLVLFIMLTMAFLLKVADIFYSASNRSHESEAQPLDQFVQDFDRNVTTNLTKQEEAHRTLLQLARLQQDSIVRILQQVKANTSDHSIAEAINAVHRNQQSLVNSKVDLKDSSIVNLLQRLDLVQQHLNELQRRSARSMNHVESNENVKRNATELSSNETTYFRYFTRFARHFGPFSIV